MSSIIHAYTDCNCLALSTKASIMNKWDGMMTKQIGRILPNVNPHLWDAHRVFIVQLYDWLDALGSMSGFCPFTIFTKKYGLH